MERKEKKPISTMMGLLRAMTHEYGSRKTGAILKRHIDPYVQEYFDDGKGHSGAFSSERTPVTEEVFQQAIRERYIGGKLEPGYVSQWEFVITEPGQQRYYEWEQFAAKLLEWLSSGQVVRVSDLQLILQTSRAVEVAVLQDILDWLVCEGYLDSHEHVGQKFYLRTIKRKIA